MQIDAFSTVPFHGNPAAVVIMDSHSSASVSPALRQKIAAEMNLSETAFVEPIESPADEEDCKASRQV